MKPLILISNDDGIDAPGISLLAQWVAPMGEVWVVAPAEGHSGMSSAMTVNSPLRIAERPSTVDGARFFTVSGTPVDCVKLAMHHILPRRPDIMVCGINHGSNAGNSVIYSGTMGAVMEACMIGIPAVGFSLLHHSWQADFSECRPLVERITADVIANGLPADTCLNVNFPARVKIKGAKTVRAARSYWTEEFKEYVDPHGKPFYWLTGRQVNEEPDNEATDLYWLDRDFATIVPCRPERTHADAIADLAGRLDC